MGALKWLLLFLSLCVISCSAPAVEQIGSPTPSLQIAPTETPKQVQPSSTPLPSATFTPEPTPAPSITPTATWVFHPAGSVTAPILMYHQIDTELVGRYNVSPENFEAQMRSLKELGYTSITTTHLIQALLLGADLPERPVLITFDDGNLGVFTHAFPIMQKYGFIGNAYIVTNYLQSDQFMGVEELTALVEAGWEIGSHSASHADLTQGNVDLLAEVGRSKSTLEQLLGTKIKTIAYPFGSVNERVVNKTYDYGYIGGLGVAPGYEHGPGSVFYLQRIEVRQEYDLPAFLSRLPWQQ